MGVIRLTSTRALGAAERETRLIADEIESA
jgi:hypothetical protein